MHCHASSQNLYKNRFFVPTCVFESVQYNVLLYFLLKLSLSYLLEFGSETFLLYLGTYDSYFHSGMYFYEFFIFTMPPHPIY